MAKTTEDLLTFFPSDHDLGSSSTGKNSIEGFPKTLSGSTGHSFDEQVDILWSWAIRPRDNRLEQEVREKKFLQFSIIMIVDPQYRPHDLCTYCTAMDRDRDSADVDMFRDAEKESHDTVISPGLD